MTDPLDKRVAPGLPETRERTMRIEESRVREVLPELIDSISDAVVVLDAQRRIVAANRRYVEAFGTSRPDVVGSACHESLLCPEILDGTADGRCTACQAITLGEPLHRVRTITPKDGGPARRWEATFNPVAAADGRVTHLIEVWRDITDRSQLEAQLSHSERLAALGQLAAGVAHEINNPLASVLASVESLQRWLHRTGLDEAARREAKDVLDACEREIGRVRETTDKLMLLGQPYTVKPGWVNLGRAAADTISLLSNQMRRQSVEVEQHLGTDVPEIWAKEGAIRSICMNLMMNAVQAMPDGGRLVVSIRHAGDMVVLDVTDTGPGVPAGIVERIWDPFFTTKMPGHGTGLGLSITRGQIERLGGSIRLDRPAGGGARFVVDLPVHGPGG